MPVHNALPHLDAAVESILSQTYSDFEFVILDDASTDGSRERLSYWTSRDERIRLISVEHNLGPSMSSEQVARAARAPIVARMDADDISYPWRLAEQVAVMDARPDVGVVGGLYDIIDPEGRIIRAAEPWRLVPTSVFPPFGNGPLMYRRTVFERVGGYRQECEFWEDQDLIIRMAAASKCLVIPHAVYQVRQSPTSTRVSSEQMRVERAVDLMYRCRGRSQRGLPYEHLLLEKRPMDARVDPRVFVSLGSMALWTGSRPRFFRRLLRRGDLSLNFRSLASIVWTGWASLSPASLRAFLRLLVRARNLYASAVVPTDRPVDWSPPVPHLRSQSRAKPLPR